MSRLPRPIAIRVNVENWIDNPFQVSLHRPLGNPIRYSRNTQDALLAVVLGNTLLPHRRREIRTRAQAIPDLIKVLITLLVKIGNRLAITARRSPILANILIGCPHQRLWYFECFSLLQNVILKLSCARCNESNPCPFAPSPLQAIHHYYGQVRPCFPIRAGSRFSRSLTWPDLNSCCLNTGCRAISRQAPIALVRGWLYNPFLTSSKISMLHQSVHLRSTVQVVRDGSISAFS